MQEALEQGTIRFAITASTISGYVLLRGCQIYLQKRREGRIKHGYMSVNELIKKDQGVSTVDVAKDKILDFANIAEKYGVDYAARFLPDPAGPRYMVFFKAKDKDAIEAIVREYTAEMLREKNRPKVREKLEKNRRKIKQADVQRGKQQLKKQKGKGLGKAARKVKRVIEREIIR